MVDGPVSGIRFLYDASEDGPKDGASPFTMAFIAPDGRNVRIRLEEIEPKALLRLLYISSVIVIQVDEDGCYIHQAMTYLDEGGLPPLHEFSCVGDTARPHDVIVDEVLDHGEGGTAWQAYVRPIEWSRSITTDRIYVELTPPPPFDPGMEFTVLGTLWRDGDSWYMDDAVLTPQCRLDAVTSDLSLEVATSSGCDEELVTAAVDEIVARHAAHCGLEDKYLVPSLRRFGQEPDLDRELRAAMSRHPISRRRNPELESLSDKLQAMIDGAA